MISLITGVPGSGKTALVVSFILEALKAGRPVFQHGIRDLTLPALPVYCGDESCEFCAGKSGDLLHDFRQWAPANALIVLDEVQRQFRVRGRAAPVPQFVADLETHRHLGVDFHMLTQDPRLIDQNIRRLVTIHRHLEPSLIGSKIRTFMTCQDDPKRATGGENASFKPPKVAFEHYKSAELHTKIKKPIPKGIWILAVAVVMGAVGGYAAISRIKGKAEEVRTPDEIAADVYQQEAPSITGLGAELVELPVDPGQQADKSKFDFEPQIDGVLESAPAYASMVAYRDFPRRVGCIAQGSRCKCYTQQGTDYPTSLSQCQAVVQARTNGFNPYLSPSPIVGGVQRSEVEVLPNGS